MQHHDAITGTAKQAVADTYAQLLDTASAQVNAQAALLIDSQFSSQENDSATKEDTTQFEACSLSVGHPADCGLRAPIPSSSTTSETFSLAAFTANISSQGYFTVWASRGAYKVSTQDGKEVESLLVCYEATKDHTPASTQEECELTIFAGQTPPQPQETQLFTIERKSEE